MTYGDVRLEEIATGHEFKLTLIKRESIGNSLRQDHEWAQVIFPADVIQIPTFLCIKCRSFVRAIQAEDLDETLLTSLGIEMNCDLQIIKTMIEE